MGEGYGMERKRIMEKKCEVPQGRVGNRKDLDISLHVLTDQRRSEL